MILGGVARIILALGGDKKKIFMKYGFRTSDFVVSELTSCQKMSWRGEEALHTTSLATH